jgi:hypothetical protein
VYLIQNKLRWLPRQFPSSSIPVILSSPLLSSQPEESECDGNEVILNLTSVSSTKLGTATSYGTADIDDSEEKQLAAAFI